MAGLIITVVALCYNVTVLLWLVVCTKFRGDYGKKGTIKMSRVHISAPRRSLTEIAFFTSRKSFIVFFSFWPFFVTSLLVFKCRFYLSIILRSCEIYCGPFFKVKLRSWLDKGLYFKCFFLKFICNLISIFI